MLKKIDELMDYLHKHSGKDIAWTKELEQRIRLADHAYKHLEALFFTAPSDIPMSGCQILSIDPPGGGGGG